MSESLPSLMPRLEPKAIHGGLVLCQLFGQELERD